MKINQRQLIEFLTKERKGGYALEGVKKIKEKDKSKTIRSKYGDWEVDDNYFGGEPYGGREVIFFKKRPVYMIVYYGFVDKSFKDFKKVYGFLKEAFRAKKENVLMRRGPKFYQSGNYTYRNWFSGGINNFSGIEKIYFGKKKIYEAKYVGGLVDQRKEKNG